MLVFKCLKGLEPSYLVCEFHCVADTESRQWLRSASTAELIISRVRCATIGGHAFPVVAVFSIKSSFLLAGNEIMEFSLLGDSASELYLRIVKWRPHLYLHASSILC